MKNTKAMRHFEIALRNCGRDKYIKKGNVYGPVICGEYIMQYCFAGRGVFEVDGKNFPAEKGECMIIFPGQQRREEADTNTPWRHIWLSFEGNAAKLFFKRLGATKENPLVRGFEQTKIPYLMQEIIELSESPEQGKDFLLASKLYEFFDECLKVNREDKAMKPKDIYVSHAVNYFDMHFTENNITVEKVANDIGIDRSYFYEIFKESMGISPKEYLTDLRIKKSKELLKMPNATVTNVAYSIGYEPSVFSKAFKSATGISPVTYMEKNKTELV